MSTILTPSSTHQTQPARQHDRAGGPRTLSEVPRDLPSAADPVRARSAAEDLRRHSRTVLRLAAAV
jgi:hypothetical protein